MKKKTLVLGASTNTDRYSNMAIKKLTQFGHPVIAVGNKVGSVNNVDIKKEIDIVDDVDTVTLYLNPTNQKPYYDQILALNPKRIIFNPGTENLELHTMAAEKGIMTLQACTLVMLSTGQY